jgi:ribonuclease P protein 3
MCYIFIFQLRDVVHHFIKDSKKVMVLGRKHMVNWPKENMNYVMKNAVVFLAEDM